MTPATHSRRLRSVLFWLHLCTGVAAGIFLAWMAATGCVLAYQRQVLAYAERSIQVAHPGASPLPLEQLVAHAAKLEGSVPAHVVLSHDPRVPVRFLLSRFAVLDLDPSTGQSLGHGAVGARHFFATVEDLHRSFGMPGLLHTPAHQVKEAINLGFLFLLLSGIVLWWPRQFRWRLLRPISVPRPGLTGKARNWNLHQVIGLWFLLPMLTIVVTGAILSYDWANDLVFRATASTIPAPDPAFHKADAARLLATLPSWQPLLDQATTRESDWRTIVFDVPDRADQPVTFTIDRGDGAHAPQQEQMRIDPASRTILRWQPWQAKSRGLKLRELARWTHTGESLGIVGQTLALLTSLAALGLIWTGFALTLARLRAYLARRSRNTTRVARLGEERRSGPSSGPSSGPR